jgi:hypothetical protein
MKRISPAVFVFLSAAGLLILRTAAALVGNETSADGYSSSDIVSLLTGIWVTALLMATAVRRHRTAWQAALDFAWAIGAGFAASVVVTSPIRLHRDLSDTLLTSLIAMVLTSPFVFLGAAALARGYVWFVRRNDGPGAALNPPSR